jgi:hypothetical protein
MEEWAVDFDAVTVELYIDGGWVDVTAYVLHDPGIAITRGRRGEGDDTAPGQCHLTLYDADRDGRWSNRVPGSTYYRKLGRNTPIRVSVDGSVRCVMEVPTWEPRWDVSGRFVSVPIEAAGILRRIAQGNNGLLSPIERSIRATSPEVYWPLGDGFESTSAASGTNGRPMDLLLGTVEFGAFTDLSEGFTTPDLSEGALTGTISGVSASSWHCEFMARVDAYDGAAAVRLHAGSLGNHAVWRFFLPGSDGDTCDVFVGDNADNVTFVLSSAAISQTLFLGNWLHYAVSAVQSGANITSKLYINGVEHTSTSNAGTLYAPSQILVGHNIGVIDSAAHIVIGSGSTISGAGAAIGDYAGETAGRRIERLCSEEGITFASVGDLDDTGVMGPQTTDSLIANLFDAARVDQGALVETRTALGLTYRTRVSLYNQVDQLTLDYTARRINPPLAPSEDDRFIWNDINVSRPSGSSARSVLDGVTIPADPQHTLTTQAPPDGAGTYDRGTTTLHVHTDQQLQLVADWIRHLGTWDELRYPVLAVELAASAWTGNPTLTSQFLALDTGDQVELDNLPAWLPPGDTLAMFQGYSEFIRPPSWSFSVNATPGWPWEVWQLDTGGSTLVVARDTDDTSFKLATSSGPGWSTTAEPYYLQVAGEAVKATTVTTDTPVLINVGTVAHANNASVSPNIPSGMTVDTGQVVLGWAAIRNSGTGTVDLPSGWTELARSGNVLFFGRYYVTGVTAPTITFSGGVANADTSARLWGMSGVSLNLDSGKYMRFETSPQAQLNSSAQDIAYPALTVRRDNCTVFVLAWKQDDWTSVATPGAMDGELIDNSTTTGDDQGIAGYYDIQTSATDIAAGSLVVTGGASAISRAIVVALRPLQTATVTRGVNGASVSPAAGDAVNGWRLGVLGL